MKKEISEANGFIWAESSLTRDGCGYVREEWRRRQSLTFRQEIEKADDRRLLLFEDTSFGNHQAKVILHFR